MQASDIDTPYLLIDEGRMQRNIERLQQHIDGLGGRLRPHVKTAKSLDVVRRLFPDGGTGPITVSTVKEAEYFAEHGFNDMIYAVGIAPRKLERIARLRKQAVDAAVILDSTAQAQAVIEAAARHGVTIPALIEIDCDGHRAGLTPDDARLVPIAERLEQAGCLRGVLLHAGGSYGCESARAKAAAADNERRAALSAAERIREAGCHCPVVSVGSTPTAHFAEDLSGVTEVRAGVYVFFDLVMAGINVCRLEDIALSVVTTVIGHREDRGWTLVDAGWMALSRDRGTATQAVDQGYGLVAEMNGDVHPDLIVAATSQEHGTITVRPGSEAALPQWPLGTRLRILPNHACATAAQHDRYYVADDGDGALRLWPRINGW